jgi:hypothetical protein
MFPSSFSTSIEALDYMSIVWFTDCVVQQIIYNCLNQITEERFTGRFLDIESHNSWINSLPAIEPSESQKEVCFFIVFFLASIIDNINPVPTSKLFSYVPLVFPLFRTHCSLIIPCPSLLEKRIWIDKWILVTVFDQFLGFLFEWQCYSDHRNGSEVIHL